MEINNKGTKNEGKMVRELRQFREIEKKFTAEGAMDAKRKIRMNRVLKRMADSGMRIADSFLKEIYDGYIGRRDFFP